MGDPIHSLFQGALLGLAAGEALGSTVDGAAPGSFEPVTGYRGEGRHRLQPGEWASSAALALCLAESLLAVRGFDRRDQLARYRRWLETGEGGCTPQAVAVTRTLRSALAPVESADALATADQEDAGALCRTAPLAMYLLHDAARAKHLAAEMARATHPGRESVDSCRYLTGLLVGALRGESKETLLSDLYSPVYNYWLFQRSALTPRVDTVARGEYQRRSEADLAVGDRPADVLASALWAFHKHPDFRSGALAAINLGGAARNRGAVFGQLAGAHYGGDAIPAEWLSSLADKVRIARLADALLKETAQGIRHFTSWDQTSSKPDSSS